MRRPRSLRSLSRSGWITVGLVIGAVAVPAIAFGAGAQLVTIRGNNNNASVTPAGQLRAAEMDPAFDINLSTGPNSQGCLPVAAPPAGRALVVKQFNIDVVSAQNAGPIAQIFVGPTCTGRLVQEVALPQRGLVTVPMGAGLAVPAGTPITVAVGSAFASVNAFGYTVQSSAVPATAAALRRLGRAKG
jgi:hypothetical protein